MLKKYHIRAQVLVSDSELGQLPKWCVRKSPQKEVMYTSPFQPRLFVAVEEALWDWKLVSTILWSVSSSGDLTLTIMVIVIERFDYYYFLTLEILH